VLFIDTDVIDYPLDMPTRLIKANPDGVSAPWVIIEDSNRFYDCSAFILKGKANPNKQGWQPDFGINILNDPPFYPPEADPTPDNPILSLDCAGTITMVSADIYKYAKYENHPSYTDHYSICQSCRNLGRKVICDRSIIAVHANLPKYGESWH
jgi:hypothetical protein